MDNKKNFIITLFLFFCHTIALALPIGNANVPQKEDNSIRIMSYNIRNGLDRNKTPQYKKIAEIIYNVSPDVVALQEVDSATLRSQGEDILKILGSECMMYTIFTPIYKQDNFINKTTELMG